MSVNPSKKPSTDPSGLSVVPTVPIPTLNLRSNENTGLDEIIEPMSGRKVVKILPNAFRLSVPPAPSSRELIPSNPWAEKKTQGLKEIRRTSDTPRSKERQEEGTLQIPREKHCSESSGSKSNRGGDKPLDKPVRSIVVPLSTFILAISKDVPEITYKKWNRNVRNFIVRQVLDPNEECQLTINDVYNRLLEFSSILRRIDRAKILLCGVEEHRYLYNFPSNSNPIHFWENYIALEKKSPLKCQELCEIIGKESLRILKKTVKSDGKAMKENIRSQIDLVSSVEEKRRCLMKCSFFFAENFDRENLHIVPTPIYLFDYQEFQESFRAYLSDGPFPGDTIRFNGKNLLIPDYKKLGIEDEDREAYFLKWLISEMQGMIKISPDCSSVEEQIKLFEEHWNIGPRAETLKLHKAIHKCFGNEFKDPCTDEMLPNKINSCFSKLKENGDSQVCFFAEQMIPHHEFICKYLISHKDFKKDWEKVSYDLIKLRHRFDFLLLKQKKIPLLSLLKAMSYSSYLTGQWFMRKTLCPNLCTMDASPYQLVLDHSQVTNYDILVEFSYFEVTHIKMFNIVSEGKVKANVQVHWTPKGELNSIKYGASQVFAKFDYLPDCPYEERKIISDLFDLEFESSPWGKYLKKGDINDFLMGTPPQVSFLDMIFN